MEKNSEIKSGIWFTVCNVIQKCVPLISVPIFTRMMSSDEYGLTAVYQSWNTMLLVVVTLCLYYGVFNNGMLHYKNDRDRFISSMQGLSTVSAVIFLALICIFAKPVSKLSGLSEKILWSMGISYIFLPAFEYWSARSRYEYRYKGLVVATIVFAVVNIAIPVICVKLGKGNLGEVKILATLAASSLFAMAFYLYNLYKGRTLYVKEYWKYALWFNIPLIPNYLSNIILGQSDRIMIGYYCGEAAAGVYSVACYLQTGVTVVSSAISAAFVPWLYDKLENRKYSSIQSRTELLLGLLGYLTLGLVTCAPELIRIITPKAYHSAIWAVPPVVIGSYVAALYTFFANVEIYYEKRIFMTYATVIAAVGNVVLNYLLIPVFGYIACAYTTVFCYVIYSAAHYLFMCRIRVKDGLVKDFKIYDMRKNCVVCTIFILLSVIQALLYNTVLLRYIIIVLISGVVFIVGRRRINA